jgi:ribosomal protein L16 Arg81 hydroxylase
MKVKNEFPYLLMISDDGYAYSGKVRYLLHISELNEIINACNKTLKLYEEKNESEEGIEKENDIAEEDEYISIIKENRKFKTKKTAIYLMYDEHTKYYKIGRSLNPTKREKTLQSEKPSIVLKYSFSGVIDDESALHDKFKDKRIRGEWFNLDELDIDYIIKYFK